tara:strand:+ start:15414 stop:15887 length:474 start_codon:yes stop_codon:yes gene_type:complete
MAFVDDVVTEYNDSKGNTPAITKSDITKTEMAWAVNEVIGDYSTDTSAALHVSTITKTSFNNNLATHGFAGVSSQWVDEQFDSKSTVTIKSYGANSADKGGFIWKAGTLYKINNHTNYDKFMAALVPKCAWKKANDDNRTLVASALATKYNTKKGLW